jgi:hypothetical protein
MATNNIFLRIPLLLHLPLGPRPLWLQTCIHTRTHTHTLIIILCVSSYICHRLGYRGHLSISTICQALRVTTSSVSTNIHTNTGLLLHQDKTTSTFTAVQCVVTRMEFWKHSVVNVTRISYWEVPNLILDSEICYPDFRFQVKTRVFLDVGPCYLINEYQRFASTCFLQSHRKTLVPIYWNTWCHILEHHNLDAHVPHSSHFIIHSFTQCFITW